MKTLRRKFFLIGQEEKDKKTVDDEEDVSGRRGCPEYGCDLIPDEDNADVVDVDIDSNSRFDVEGAAANVQTGVEVSEEEHDDHGRRGRWTGETGWSINNAK